MYVVTVEFSIVADHLDAFTQAMNAQAVASLEKEVDCHQFDVCFDPESPTTCFLYELYTDKAAFDLHLESQHFQDFSAKVADWVSSKTVKTYERVWPKS